MINELTISLLAISRATETNILLLAKLLAIFWGVFLLDIIMHHSLLYLGIIPRRFIGLPGIIFAPFLHSNFNHLFFNSIPFIVLSNFILILGTSYFFWVSFIIIIVSGMLIWCFARPGIYIGASALITGYWSLLISQALYSNGLIPIILGIVSIYYFIGIFYGIFPSKKGVSWEGHLFGLLAGIICPYVLPIIYFHTQ